MAPKLAPLAPLKPLGGAKLGALPPVGSADLRDKAQAVFKETDRSGDGLLQKDELYAAMWKLGGSDDPETILSYGGFIDREFAKADKDLSGALDFDEFLGIFSTYQAAQAASTKQVPDSPSKGLAPLKPPK